MGEGEDVWNGGNVEPRIGARSQVAFTLIELLVVIVIIGILTSIGLPAIRGMTKSNVAISANRQLLDDIAYARSRAIADHTTVYMVFIPAASPQTVNFASLVTSGNANSQVLSQYTNLYEGQYTAYALVSLRSVGDQPGRQTTRYLTAWRSLPKGCFIATNKFAFIQGAFSPQFPELDIRPFNYTNTIPFPVATNTTITFPTLPYVAFDYQGRLVSQQDEYIPLAIGSILYAPGANGAGIDLTQPADVLETPAGNSFNQSNVIHIDWLTGKARIERQEVQ